MFFARFINYFLFDQGLVPCEEPFRDLVPQGIVRGRTHVDPATGRYVVTKDVEQSGDSFVVAQTGALLESTFEKMSKSKHNGVDPLEVIQKDGVDLTRLQLLDAASPRANLDWGTSDLKGIKLWIDRISRTVNVYIESRKNAKSGDPGNKVSEDVEKIYKENYNFFVRNVRLFFSSLCPDTSNLDNDPFGCSSDPQYCDRETSRFNQCAESKFCLYSHYVNFAFLYRKPIHLTLVKASSMNAACMHW